MFRDVYIEMHILYNIGEIVNISQHRENLCLPPKAVASL